MEGVCRVLRIPVGATGGVSNPGVVVSAMAGANIKGMIYYIKHFKRIGRTCTHIDVELSKVRAMYHQRDMEEVQNYPKVVPTANPRDWPKTLKILEEYIRGFCGVYGKPLIYGLMYDFIALVAASDPMYRTNGSEYFTHNEEMITQG